ncbi:MAG: gluconokinase [Verrucomicrobiota bacterium]
MARDPIYLMGVSGCGKSVIGRELATQLCGTFLDGDDLHPAANKEKMKQGLALNDVDRLPWFDLIKQNILDTKNKPVVMACSALKRNYRALLRQGFENAAFVYLEGDFDLIMSRIKKRDHEYMPVDLLRSQFDTLEVPTADEKVIKVNIDNSVVGIVAEICQQLSD